MLYVHMSGDILMVITALSPGIPCWVTGPSTALSTRSHTLHPSMNVGRVR